MPHRVLTETVTIPVPGAPDMGGFLARPAPGAETAGPGAPAVLVGMELFGVSAHVRDVCERLAAAGYRALAPDLYHRSAPGVELPADAAGRDRGFALLDRLTRQDALEDLAAAVRALQEGGGRVVGMLGLSVGGHVAYLAATDLHLPAVAVAYGGWLPTTDIPLSRPEPTLARTPGITGRVLVVVGDDDPVVPAEHRALLRDALDAAGVDHELVVYPGVGHGFLCARRDGHDPAAAADAWRRVLALFAAADAQDRGARCGPGAPDGIEGNSGCEGSTEPLHDE